MNETGLINLEERRIQENILGKIRIPDDGGKKILMGNGIRNLLNSRQEEFVRIYCQKTLNLMTMTIAARMNKDIALMKLRALSGDADAAWQCGYALLNGKYEHETRGIVFCREDKREGLKWLKYAAEHGCVPAMLELGAYVTSLCQGGYSDEKKLQEGLCWEKKAWRHGEPMSALNIAVTYAMLKRNRRTVYWLHKAYDHCRWAAILPLAKAYLFGFGVRRNIGKAADLLSELVKNKEAQKEDVKRAEEYLEAIRLKQTIKCPTSLF